MQLGLNRWMQFERLVIWVNPPFERAKRNQLAGGAEPGIAERRTRVLTKSPAQLSDDQQYRESLDMDRTKGTIKEVPRSPAQKCVARIIRPTAREY